MKTPILSAVLGAAVIAALAGCTSTNTQADKTPTPTTTSSPTATIAPDWDKRTAVADEKNVTVPDKKATATCKKGAATIDQSSSAVTLKGSCDNVTITAGNSIITLGDVKHLTVKGNINRITAHSIGEITIDKKAKANDVIYSGGKPTIHDDGQATKFATK